MQRLSGVRTAHIVHLVQAGGRRRYIEDRGANAGAEIGDDDVARRCDANTTMLLSTALPVRTAMTAARTARNLGATVAVDASGEADTVRAVLGDTIILRCDADEAQRLTGREQSDLGAAAETARELLAAGPATVVVGAAGGDVVVTGDGTELRLPHRPVATPVDPTGAGDAFIGTLIAMLARGERLERCAHLASAAAAHTVAHLGGRPQFDLDALSARLGP